MKKLTMILMVVLCWSCGSEKPEVSTGWLKIAMETGSDFVLDASHLMVLDGDEVRELVLTFSAADGVLESGEVELPVGSYVVRVFELDHNFREEPLALPDLVGEGFQVTRNAETVLPSGDFEVMAGERLDGASYAELVMVVEALR